MKAAAMSTRSPALLGLGLLIGEMQAGIGFGVKKFRQFRVFQSRAAFDDFINNGYGFGDQATMAAQASEQGRSFAGAASVSPGVWLYQLTDDGLAAELTFK